MPWCSEIEAEGRIVPRQWQIGRQATEIIEPEASNDNTVGLAITAGARQPLGSDFVVT